MKINDYLSVNQDPRSGFINLTTRKFSNVPTVKVSMSRENALTLMEFLGKVLATEELKKE